MESAGNPRLKVLLVITKSNFGGAQRYVYDLATALPTEKFDVAVVCGGAGVLITKLTAAGIRTISIPELARDIYPLKDIAAFAALVRVLKQERPDVLHLNSSKVGGIGALAGRIVRTPRIIFTAHGWAFNENRGLIQKILIKIISWLTILLTHKTITVSRAMYTQVAAWPFVKQKMATVINGITPPELYPRPKARALLCAQNPAIDPSTHTYWIGTIAELHPIKGLDTAISAMRNLVERFPDTQYVVLGEGEDRNRLETLIAVHDLASHLHLIGFIDDAARYLNAFDLFILPSRSEGLGYVLLEAGAAGLPIIATNVGGIPEIISSPEHGVLIAPDDVAALTTTMCELREQPKRSTDMSQAIQAHVAKKFSTARMIEETLRIYTSL